MESTEYVVLVRDVESLINKEIDAARSKLVGTIFSDHIEYSNVFSTHKSLVNFLDTFREFAKKAQDED